MKKIFLLIALPYQLIFAQTTAETFVNNLMSKMTLQEKIGQLNLITPGWGLPTGAVVSKDIEEKIKSAKVGGIFGAHGPETVRRIQDLAIQNTRLKIPLLFGSDVIHGYQTTFPIPLGLACSWDMNLIEESARIAALEASSNGICWTFSPMVDICRDPRWGRIAEGAGEDPLLGSDVAKAMVYGYQGRNAFNEEQNILACVKHFALYGAAESGRDYNPSDMSRIRMFQDYLPPYKAAVEAGVASLMTSFNEIDGIPATGNKWLLTDILRNQWGFRGMVVSDYTSVNEMIDHGIGNLAKCSAMALDAGLDMDMVGEGYLTTIEKSLAEGKVKIEDIDRACKNILIAKYKIGLFDNPYKFVSEEKAKNNILNVSNRKKARHAAASSIVLLKNENNLLPIKTNKKIALIGPLAHDRANMLGTWSVSGDPLKAVSIYEGFQNAKLNFLYSKGANISDDTSFAKNVNSLGLKIDIDKKNSKTLLKEAISVAKKSEIIIAIVGEASEMSGESSSRTDISLPSSQKILLKELSKLHKPMIIVIMAGRPMTIEEEFTQSDALLYMWHAGTEAGNALADIITAKAIPCAKLVNTFPRSIGQIPIYYNHKNTGRPQMGNSFQKFKSNYLDESNDGLFPFGYGLTYSKLQYSNLKLDKTSINSSEKLIATIDIKNNGEYDAHEIVQCYIHDLEASVTRPVKELKKYSKVFIPKTQTKTVSFEISESDLRFFNSNLEYISEPGEFMLMIGANSKETMNTKFELRK